MSKKTLVKAASTRKGAPPPTTTHAAEAVDDNPQLSEEGDGVPLPPSRSGALASVANVVTSETNSRETSPRNEGRVPTPTKSDEGATSSPMSSNHPHQSSSIRGPNNKVERQPSMLVKKRRATSPGDDPAKLLAATMVRLQECHEECDAVRNDLSEARKNVLEITRERDELLEKMSNTQKECAALTQLAQEYRTAKLASDRELAMVKASGNHHSTELKALRAALKKSEAALEQSNLEVKHLRDSLRFPAPCEYCTVTRAEGDKFRKQNKELRNIISQMEDEEIRHVPHSERVRPLTKANIHMKQQNLDLLQKVSDLVDREKTWSKDKVQLETSVKQLTVQLSRAAAHENRVMELEVQNQLLLTMIQKEKGSKKAGTGGGGGAHPSLIPRGGRLGRLPGEESPVGGGGGSHPQRPPRVLPPIIEARALDQEPPKPTAHHHRRNVGGDVGGGSQPRAAPRIGEAATPSSSVAPPQQDAHDVSRLSSISRRSSSNEADTHSSTRVSSAEHVVHGDDDAPLQRAPSGPQHHHQHDQASSHLQQDTIERSPSVVAHDTVKEDTSFCRHPERQASLTPSSAASSVQSSRPSSHSSTPRKESIVSSERGESSAEHKPQSFVANSSVVVVAAASSAVFADNEEQTQKNNIHKDDSHDDSLVAEPQPQRSSDDEMGRVAEDDIATSPLVAESASVRSGDVVNGDDVGNAGSSHDNVEKHRSVNSTQEVVIDVVEPIALAAPSADHDAATSDLDPKSGDTPTMMVQSDDNAGGNRRQEPSWLDD
jgi:hypothetical protein